MSTVTRIRPVTQAGVAPESSRESHNDNTPLECAHCGGAVSGGVRFCCHGCEAAYDLVRGFGLDAYYRRRTLDVAQRSLKPDPDAPAPDFDGAVSIEKDGTKVLHLMVDGLQCAACVWLIEQVLARDPAVVAARLNMTTRRLAVRWRGDKPASDVVAPVLALGYRLAPYDPAVLDAQGAREEKELLRALAVAGFAAGNVMLLSVAIWAGHSQGMGPATRDLLHWISALIALPAIAWAGLPFFRSALGALRQGRTNMDVPISLGVILASAVSIAETMHGGAHAYFDSAVTLLFFLLVGRYLDRRARGRARSAGAQLLALRARAATVRDADGKRHLVSPDRLVAGTTILVAAGERIAADGTVAEGESALDESLISGESTPRPVDVGDRVFAGTLNLAAPLAVRTCAVGEGTLLAEIARMTEAAEQGRARYVALADRVARLYAPVVHGLALATFLGWSLLAGLAWTHALTIAVAVLIVTCPCALALAVPAVQVAATGRLMRHGILVKSPTALERIAECDTIVFDKTGTLTVGRLELRDAGSIAPGDLALAASMAAVSRHPLARAIARAVPETAPVSGIREVPGCGLVMTTPGGDVRLGNRRWLGLPEDGAAGPELWLARPGHPPVRFGFADAPRPDAAPVVADLKRRGFHVVLLSGDREAAVVPLAHALGIEDWQAETSPAGKSERLARLAAEGRRVLMVGDGLNDAPALAAARASLSPASAADIAQTAADAVFQGERLAPVQETLAVARLSGRIARQNLGFAILYNVLAVPLAAAGWLTPLIAAVAMSSSSLVVIGNALRAGRT